ncbi:MAG: bifunctional glutamate N-acetyltransferase/amino-acid acetyltransferase ArgJ [Halofilum sp. (in: g-proteobacteria)]|nr:bifunctional glutamate N-acetyltransferase/amino-acid acetyltransferase ArgJ [Halofilum sp. (in: g-proteobacteria)]
MSDPLEPQSLALLPVKGVELAATRAGIKASGRPDVVLVRFAAGSRTAAVFTRNSFRAAPVHVAQRHLARKSARLLLINSGCANAGTGAAGEQDAEDSCRHAATAAGVDATSVLPFSTGVIGQRLPMDRLRAGIEECAGRFAPDADAWTAAATAILTTDTRPKGSSRRVALSGGEVTVTGIAKGSGMIRPDMATMLAFVCTDADVAGPELDAMLRRTVDGSFHCITVDGDTSTNDAVTLTATGASGVPAAEASDLDQLEAAIGSVCMELAQAIVGDAEGVTRVIEIEVSGGRDRDECRAVAFTVAHSPLVKTAVFGGDPNWGRILAAVGRAPVIDLDVARVDISLDRIALVRAGQPVEALDEAAAAAAMSGNAVRIRIDLGRGEAVATVWTSDLSHEYVRINADYRT